MGQKQSKTLKQILWIAWGEISMKKIKVVVVGCGDRACVYANEGVNTLQYMEVVAAVDPNPERLKYMQILF